MIVDRADASNPAPLRDLQQAHGEIHEVVDVNHVRPLGRQKLLEAPVDRPVAHAGQQPPQTCALGRPAKDSKRQGSSGKLSGQATAVARDETDVMAAPRQLPGKVEYVRLDASGRIGAELVQR